MIKYKRFFVIGFISLLVLSVNVMSYGGEKGNNISNGEKKMKEEIKKRREKARANLDKLIEELRNGPEIAGREFAAIDLGTAEDPRAIPALIEAMKNDPVLSVRRSAISSLGMIGDKSAIPALKEGLKDEEIKLECAFTLWRLGERDVSIPILEYAIETGEIGGIDFWGNLGEEKNDKDAIELVKKAIKSKSKEIREAAKFWLDSIEKAEQERKIKKMKKAKP